MCATFEPTGRVRRELQTLAAMISMYCRKRHGSSAPCSMCAELAKYAARRLENCPFGQDKTTCVHCTVHCYRSDMRERIREIMRFAGPRMLLRHPILAIAHMFDSRMDARRQQKIDAGKVRPSS